MGVLGLSMVLPSGWGDLPGPSLLGASKTTGSARMKSAEYILSRISYGNSKKFIVVVVRSGYHQTFFASCGYEFNVPFLRAFSNSLMRRLNIKDREMREQILSHKLYSLLRALKQAKATSSQKFSLNRKSRPQVNDAYLKAMRTIR